MRKHPTITKFDGILFRTSVAVNESCNNGKVYGITVITYSKFLNGTHTAATLAIRN